MKKNFVLVLFAFMMVCASLGFSQNPIPMSQWKVAQPDARDASEVTAQGITLRIYSQVVWENVNMEMSAISMQVRSLSNMPTDQNLNLNVEYDCGLVEIVRVEFPGSNTRTTRIDSQLAMNHGRSIRQLSLGHGRSGGRYLITEMSYTPATPTAKFMDQSNLTGAQLHPGTAVHHDVWVVKGSMTAPQRPYITHIPSHKLQLTASVTGFQSRSEQLKSNTTEYNLTILVDDREGNRLKTLRIPLGLQVRDVEVDLTDIDHGLIDRMVFMSNYSGIQFAIRQINFGQAVVSSPGCPGLREINQRFRDQIENWKQEGMMGRRYLDELESILRELEKLQ